MCMTATDATNTTNQPQEGNMTNSTHNISYSAFGRSFPSSQEAEAYGLSLLSSVEAWEGIVPPTSFTIFQSLGKCRGTFKEVVA